MTLNSMIIRQRDFSGGEIDPDSNRRDDTDIFKAGVKFARNLQCTSSGGLERRAGRRVKYARSGRIDTFQPFHDGLKYDLVFSANALTVLDQSATVLAVLTGPWSAANLPSLVWDFYENNIFICGPAMRTQVVTVAESSRAWSIAPFSFQRKLSGTYQAPFYRFGSKGVTMTVSAGSGSGIAVTFSAAVLNPAHVGCVFEYAGRQLVITSVVSPTQGVATALESLAPTVQYNLTDTTEVTGFTIGEIAQTSTSGVQIEITAVSVVGKAVAGVILNQYRQRTSDDRLVGPNADANTESMDIVAAGATTQWKEIFMSDYRGWPQSVAVDNNRIIFSDFPQFKAAIVWSAVDDPLNYLIDAVTPDSAIFEYLQADCRVFHVVGGYDEFAITDRGVFYIPVSADNPLAPGSVEFHLLYSGRISSVRPVQVTEDALFVDEAQTGIFAINATGAQARPYQVTELAPNHRHLFSGIMALASTSGTPQNPNRQVFVVNDDGTLVLGQYNVEKQYVGWLKQDGQGAVLDVNSRFDEAKFVTSYPIGPSQITVVEQSDVSACGDSIMTPAGGKIPVNYAGATLQVWADGFYLGDALIGGDGTVPGIGAYSSIQVGYLFEWSLIPLFSDTEGGANYQQRMRRRRIARVAARVQDTQAFSIGNREFAGYVGGDDFALPMPARTDTFTYRGVGRSFDPEVEIKQAFPGAFKLLELTTEITV